MVSNDSSGAIAGRCGGEKKCNSLKPTLICAHRVPTGIVKKLLLLLLQSNLQQTAEIESTTLRVHYFAPGYDYKNPEKMYSEHVQKKERNNKTTLFRNVARNKSLTYKKNKKKKNKAKLFQLLRWNINNRWLFLLLLSIPVLFCCFRWSKPHRSDIYTASVYTFFFSKTTAGSLQEDTAIMSIGRSVGFSFTFFDVFLGWLHFWHEHCAYAHPSSALYTHFRFQIFSSFIMIYYPIFPIASNYKHAENKRGTKKKKDEDINEGYSLRIGVIEK